MTTKRVLPRMNSTVWLLLAAAILRGIFDMIRFQLDASREFWPDNWYHDIMFFPAVMIAVLVVSARWRPLLAVTAAVMVQALITLYFSQTVGSFAAAWAQPEGYIYLFLGAALCTTFIRRLSPRTDNSSVASVIFTTALVRCAIDLPSLLAPEGLSIFSVPLSSRLQNPLVVAIVVLNLLVFALAANAIRHPFTSLTLALLWQLPVVAFFLNGDGWPILIVSPVPVLIVGLVVSFVLKLRQIRHASEPFDISSKDDAATT